MQPPAREASGCPGAAGCGAVTHPLVKGTVVASKFQQLRVRGKHFLTEGNKPHLRIRDMPLRSRICHVHEDVPRSVAFSVQGHVGNPAGEPGSPEPRPRRLKGSRAHTIDSGLHKGPRGLRETDAFPRPHSRKKGEIRVSLRGCPQSRKEPPSPHGPRHRGRPHSRRSAGQTLGISWLVDPSQMAPRGSFRATLPGDSNSARTILTSRRGQRHLRRTVSQVHPTPRASSTGCPESLAQTPDVKEPS